MDDFVWLTHPATDGVARFSAEAAPIWRKRGWVDTTEPDPVDPTKAHLVGVEAPADADPAVPDDVPPPGGDAPKTTRRSAGSSAEKEQA